LAAIKEAVSVGCEGAASDGVDMDKTVMKNTEIKISSLALHQKTAIKTTKTTSHFGCVDYILMNSELLY